jgi:4-amino-4-deoxy-L-arabinose transferase-like glycosyltransferase
MDKLGFKSIFASRVQLTQVVVLFFIAIFNFFFFLDRPPVETWDEAIYGVNAFEMFQSGNIFQVTFGNQIDYSNLKPALGVILSALAFKFGGVSLFSLRFFSALSGFLSVFIVYLYSRRLFGSFAGFFSGMTLATTYGFVCKHAARNGDFDVVLTLFL